MYPFTSKWFELPFIFIPYCLAKSEIILLTVSHNISLTQQKSEYIWNEQRYELFAWLFKMLLQLFTVWQLHQLISFKSVRTIVTFYYLQKKKVLESGKLSTSVFKWAYTFWDALYIIWYFFEKYLFVCMQNLITA